MLATVIFDCIPENQAPSWWKTPLMGPSFPTGHKPAPKEMRRPGCNGGVCYCNTENYCNDRHKAVQGLDECPSEQPHSKWDRRCVGAEASASRVDTIKPQALVTSGGGHRLVTREVIVKMWLMLTPLLWRQVI